MFSFPDLSHLRGRACIKQLSGDLFLADRLMIALLTSVSEHFCSKLLLLSITAACSVSVFLREGQAIEQIEVGRSPHKGVVDFAARLGRLVHGWRALRASNYSIRSIRGGLPCRRTSQARGQDQTPGTTPANFADAVAASGRGRNPHRTATEDLAG